MMNCQQLCSCFDFKHAVEKLCDAVGLESFAPAHRWSVMKGILREAGRYAREQNFKFRGSFVDQKLQLLSTISRALVNNDIGLANKLLRLNPLACDFVCIYSGGFSLVDAQKFGETYASLKLQKLNQAKDGKQAGPSNNNNISKKKSYGQVSALFRLLSLCGKLMPHLTR